MVIILIYSVQSFFGLGIIMLGLVDRLISGRVRCLAGSLAGRYDGGLPAQLAGWLAGCVGEWLAGRHAGWLAGWVNR